MSVQLTGPLFDHFDASVAAITTEEVNVAGGGFKPSGYRMTPDTEPDAGLDGLYYLDLNPVAPKGRSWGTGENIWAGTMTVQLGFFRGGGDLGGAVVGGDRRSVAVRANNDCMRVSDACENPDRYLPAAAIREVRYLGHGRSFTGKKTEVWTVRFSVEWRSDLVNDASTVTSTPSSGSSAEMMTIAGEYGSTDTVGEEDVVGQPVFVDFDDVTWANVVARLMGAARVTGGTGTFSLRMGGTLGAANGSVVATGTTTSSSYAPVNFTGSPFVNPTGVQLLQVTFNNGTVGQTSWIKGISIGLRSA